MLQFVREIPIRIVIQKTLSHRRGFLFHVSAGFSAPVDPLSGMAVNLMAVDRWLADVKNYLESEVFTTSYDSLNLVFAHLISESAKILGTHSSKEQAQLVSLNFREERGFGFSLDTINDNSSDLHFYHSHYVERVSSLAEAALLRLTFHWKFQPGCEADFAHEGFKLLKPLSESTAEDLIEKLSTFKGHKTSAGSSLNKIIIHTPQDQSKLEL